MIRKKKLFSRPKKAFQKTRIEEENKLLKQYGLKNKREVWKSIAKITYFRTRAMALAKKTREEQNVFLGKLKALGFKTNSIADVLALQVEDLLKRRLPTIVASRGLANSVQQARQMVVHKKIRINGNVVNVPSYLVFLAEEPQIVSTQKLVKPQEKKESKAEDKTEAQEEAK
jgi:small subunit ribosomal protein S4